MTSNDQSLTSHFLDLAARHADTIRARSRALADEVLSCRASFVTCGVGTSSYAAMKLAHLLGCYGIRAAYRDVLELGHGQMGSLGKDDTICAITLSGKTRDLVELFHVASRIGLRRIAVCGRPQSSLAAASNILISIDFAVDVDPDHGVATISSALISLLVSETCAVVSGRKALSSEDLLTNHPFGSVAERLKLISGH